MSAVRIKTAVVGNQPNNHDAKLAIAVQNVSLDWSNLVCVICHAIFADIIVSNIDITDITNQLIKVVCQNSKLENVSFFDASHNRQKSANWKTKLGNLSANNCISKEKNHIWINHQNIIHNNAIGIGAGTEGINLFHDCRRIKAITKIQREIIFTWSIWWKVSIKFCITDSCFGISISHKIVLSWPNAIVNETHAIKPCNAVAGIKVTYLVRRNAQITRDHKPTTIARIGKYQTSWVEL